MKTLPDLKKTSRLINQQDRGAWKNYMNDPFPGWGSHALTLFNLPFVSMDQLADTDMAIASVPFDGTASTRPGSKYGPRSIKEASLSYSSQLTLRGPVQLRNMRDGKLHEVHIPKIVDLGDLHVYPTNTVKQMQATVAEVSHIVSKCGKIILLGGEHALSYPFFTGTASNYPPGSVGYVQIDNHFDFGYNSEIHGPYYHGSNSRRISELPFMSLDKMGYCGVGDFTIASQYDHLINHGTAIRNMAEIRKSTFQECLIQVLDQVSKNVDHLYISIDIDVCDTATATGTGHTTVGGINSSELMSAASILHNYPVIGLDIVEVSPPYDPSGATSSLAARFLYEWIFLKEII